MGVGTKQYVIRKRDLVEKRNGLFWKDGIQGVHPHPVNERLLRSIKKSFPAKAFEVLGSWEEWEEFRDRKDNGKAPEIQTVKPQIEQTKSEPEPEKEKEEKEVVSEFDSMNMAELREVAKGLLDQSEINTYKGPSGRVALTKRLKAI